MKPNYFLKQILGTLIFFSLIFLSAGRIIYWQGLAYVIIGFIMLFLNYTVLRLDAGLLEERSKPGTDTKKWDKAILGISLLVTISMYIIAGLDSGRFHWSPDFHLNLYIFGGFLTAAGQLIFLIAQKQNKFFSSTVRIQTDREHIVCDKGLYKLVRHPAYMGSIIQSFGFPMFFGSVWSIIPVGIMIALLFLRTYLEDKTLKNELKGYREYAGNTKFKVIPFIW